jgi:UDP-sulfoquinovose synthase
VKLDTKTEVGPRMRVLVLGGDGYLGWPTAMHLAKSGHVVAVVDNYLRRNLMRDHDVEPLYAVPNLHERVASWSSSNSGTIHPYIGDLRDWTFVERVFSEFQPDAVVHYAEQPSAPFSMLSREAATLTLLNNVGVTANVIYAVRQFCPDAHIVKLGTMGEYGTPNIDIEEGWLDVEHNGRTDRFLYPRQAGSLYHTTKIMDTDLLWFYVRTWGLRVTDLMQGPVYGIFIDDEKIVGQLPFFSYDELFGTVLNRFVVQAVAGHPLTVYGKGGQTRGYINIKDTVRCVHLSLENPPREGELRIFNQFTETFSVNEIADIVIEAANREGFPVEKKQVRNPRKEREEHYYNPRSTGLLDLGLEPNYLTIDIVAEMIRFVAEHARFIASDRITKEVRWN